MRSTATVRTSAGVNKISLATGERTHSIEIPPKPSGFGSSVSGGELLVLALATCYCNDIYREAAKLGIEVTHVEAECGAAFPAEGEPAAEITYRVRIAAKASEQQILELAALTDRRAEIHGTVRGAIPVRLAQVEAESA